MKYRWNVNNEFCGVDYTDTEGTEKPVRTLRKGERAYWTGDEWTYDFSRKWRLYDTPIKYANFKINRNCNRNCSYCAIGKDYVNNNIVSEDKMMETFYRAFRKAKKLCEEKGFTIIPQISGGEPTLMSYENQERIIACFKEYKRWTLLTNGADTSSPLFKNAPEILLHIVDWQDGSFLNNKFDSRISYCIVVTRGEIDFLEPILKKNNSLDPRHYIAVKPELLGSETSLSEEELSQMHKITVKYYWQDNFDVWQSAKERGKLEVVHKICSHLKRNTWIFDCQNENECQPCCGVPCEMVSLKDFTGERTASCDECNIPEVGYLDNNILRKVFGENEVL